MLQVFGSSSSMEGHRGERLHLKVCLGVLEAPMTYHWNVPSERTIGTYHCRACGRYHEVIESLMEVSKTSDVRVMLSGSHCLLYKRQHHTFSRLTGQEELQCEMISDDVIIPPHTLCSFRTLLSYFVKKMLQKQDEDEKPQFCRQKNL